ncbi:MAG: aspartate/glutamate racemase family protein [Candidatus Abyssobacteria bacterium SURF_5]|uniref:Aspartate/glutamate racemase family protein n=1 Tax=Abyssobacteria bacterium (strain SURF_5) TaxID=2093360 RepID=A0A3A4P2J8_ABYX5|nr:MAG: aspartate/glutamate racemase family protein [Candidatus Abyssubacteria bacterium SURF_5]
MHKKIGILGGLSPESTVTYYQYITREYTRRFGNHAYPEIIIYSVCFQQYVDWWTGDRWDRITESMIAAARALEKAGADFGIIATNTMHIVFDDVQRASRLPFLNLIDATAEAIQAKKMTKVGLLGTKFTMNKTFYRDRLASHGITALVPDEPSADDVHTIIMEELVQGRLLDTSRLRIREIISSLAGRGAEGVILGCTEIPLLISETDSALPLFDTTTIHARKALEYAVSGK